MHTHETQLTMVEFYEQGFLWIALGHWCWYGLGALYWLCWDSGGPSRRNRLECRGENSGFFSFLFLFSQVRPALPQLILGTNFTVQLRNPNKGHSKTLYILLTLKELIARCFELGLSERTLSLKSSLLGHWSLGHDCFFSYSWKVYVLSLFNNS